MARSTQPALAAIKLAWWRERLEALDQGEVPAEPRLQAAAAELLSRGITGAGLAGLEESWAQLLQPWTSDEFERGVASRGQALFALAAQLLGVAMTDALGEAARSFAAADLARRGITMLPPQTTGWAKSKSPPGARPLSAFAVLARRDLRAGGPPFEQEATPGRAWALLRHWLTGRY